MALQKQAKTLSKGQVEAVLAYLAKTRWPKRNNRCHRLAVSAWDPPREDLTRKAKPVMTARAVPVKRSRRLIFNPGPPGLLRRPAVN
jgi:hypothetical protein